MAKPFYWTERWRIPRTITITIMTTVMGTTMSMRMGMGMPATVTPGMTICTA